MVATVQQPLTKYSREEAKEEEKEMMRKMRRMERKMNEKKNEQNKEVLIVRFILKFNYNNTIIWI